jgi:hypothetical protein
LLASPATRERETRERSRFLTDADGEHHDLACIQGDGVERGFAFGPAGDTVAFGEPPAAASFFVAWVLGAAVLVAAVALVACTARPRARAPEIVSPV